MNRRYLIFTQQNGCSLSPQLEAGVERGKVKTDGLINVSQPVNKQSQHRLRWGGHVHQRIRSTTDTLVTRRQESNCNFQLLIQPEAAGQTKQMSRRSERTFTQLSQTSAAFMKTPCRQRSAVWNALSGTARVPFCARKFPHSTVEVWSGSVCRKEPQMLVYTFRQTQNAGVTQHPVSMCVCYWLKSEDRVILMLQPILAMEGVSGGR